MQPNRSGTPLRLSAEVNVHHTSHRPQWHDTAALAKLSTKHCILGRRDLGQPCCRPPAVRREAQRRRGGLGRSLATRRGFGRTVSFRCRATRARACSGTRSGGSRWLGLCANYWLQHTKNECNIQRMSATYKERVQHACSGTRSGGSRWLGLRANYWLQHTKNERNMRRTCTTCESSTAGYA